jgi:hypothetical protein
LVVRRRAGRDGAAISGIDISTYLVRPGAIAPGVIAPHAIADAGRGVGAAPELHRTRRSGGTWAWRSVAILAGSKRLSAASVALEKTGSAGRLRHRRAGNHYPFHLVNF